MESEVWRVVPKYPNYELSESLVLRNRKTGYVKKFYLDENGYLRTNVEYEGIKKKPGLHQLVAMTFIPNPENKPEVNHIDTNKLNNHWTNLEWLTKEEHRRHSNLHELHGGIKKADVIFIRQNYHSLGVDFLSKKYGKSEYSIMSIAAGWTRKNIDYPFVKITRKSCIEGVKKAVINILTGEVFLSSEEAAAASGFTKRYLQRAMSNERPNYTPYRYFDHKKGTDVSLYDPIKEKPIPIPRPKKEKPPKIPRIKKEKPIKKPATPAKKIVKKDINGTIVENFDSLGRLSRLLNVDKSNLRKIISGKKGENGYYKGYFYKYV